VVVPFVFSASLVQICTLNSICLNDVFFVVLKLLFVLSLYRRVLVVV
jgi:hypothetical protein